MHEFGHYVPAKIFNSNPQFKWRGSCLIMTSYPDSRFKSIIIAVGGIVAGFIPLVVAYPYLELYAVIIVGMLMLAGCRVDFKFLYDFFGFKIKGEIEGI